MIVYIILAQIGGAVFGLAVGAAMICSGPHMRNERRIAVRVAVIALPLTIAAILASEA